MDAGTRVVSCVSAGFQVLEEFGLAFCFVLPLQARQCVIEQDQSPFPVELALGVISSTGSIR